MKNSPFFLLSLSAIAQILSFVGNPFLSRFYTPVAFGELASFTAFVMIVSNLSNLRLEIQLLTCNSAEETVLRSVIRGLNLIAALLGSLVYLIISPHKNLTTTIVYALVAFLLVIILGETRAKYNVLNKLGDYKRLGLSNVSRACGNVFISLLFSFSYFGLVVGFVASRILENKTLWLNDRLQFPNRLVIKGVITKYSGFIKADVPTALISNLNTNMDLIGVSTLFGLEFGGTYYMGKRLLETPMNLIGKTLLDVFKNKSNGSVSTKELKRFVHRIFKYSIVLSIMIVMVNFNLDWVIPKLLGGGWSASILVIHYLSIVSFFRLLAKPISFIFYVEKEYTKNFWYQSVHFILLSLSFVVGFGFEEPLLFLKTYCILGSIYYIILTYSSYNLLEKSD